MDINISTTTYSTTFFPEDNVSNCSYSNATDSNGTCLDVDPMSDTAHFPYATLCFCAVMAFIIATIGTFGNLLTIVSLSMCKKLRTGRAASATTYVINLAVAELLFCVCILPMSGAQYLYFLLYPGHTLLNDRACVFFTTARYTITQAELQTILAIALTRAIAVRNPRLYMKINTTWITNAYIIGIWLWSFGMRLPITTGVFGNYVYNSITYECDISVGDSRVRLIYILLEIIIPVPIIIFLYLMIFYVVWRSSQGVKMLAKQSQVPEGRKNSTMPLNSERKDSLLPLQRERIESICPDAKERIDTLGRPNKNRKPSLQVFRLKTQTLTRKSSIIMSDNKREVRLAGTIFVVFLVVVVCSIPVGVEHALSAKKVKNITKFLLVHVLYWSQYCINIFVYVLMNRQYRDAYVECLSHFIPKFNSCKKKRFLWEQNSASMPEGRN